MGVYANPSAKPVAFHIHIYVLLHIILKVRLTISFFKAPASLKPKMLQHHSSRRKSISPHTLPGACPSPHECMERPESSVTRQCIMQLRANTVSSRGPSGHDLGASLELRVPLHKGPGAFLPQKHDGANRHLPPTISQQLSLPRCYWGQTLTLSVQMARKTCFSASPVDSAELSPRLGSAVSEGLGEQT